MAKYHGKAGFFSIDAADLSAYITDISLEEPIDTAETTTMGQDAKTYVEGMSDATIAISGVWDDTAATGPDAILSGLKTTGANAFVYGPSGDTTGMVEYTGNAILTNYARTTPVADVVSFTASFQVTGPVTRGAF